MGEAILPGCRGVQEVRQYFFGKSKNQRLTTPKICTIVSNLILKSNGFLREKEVLGYAEY
jgi:hypothetical protein